MTVGLWFCSVLYRVSFGFGSCTFLTFGFALVLDKTWVLVRFVLAGLMFFPISIFNKKKCSEETQTLHAGISKAEPKIFAPPDFLGARDGQNLISWRRSLSLPTNIAW